MVAEFGQPSHELGARRSAEACGRVASTEDLDIRLFLRPFRLLPLVAICVPPFGVVAFLLVLTRCVVVPEAHGLLMVLALPEVTVSHLDLLWRRRWRLCCDRPTSEYQKQDHKAERQRRRLPEQLTCQEVHRRTDPFSKATTGGQSPRPSEAMNDFENSKPTPPLDEASRPILDR